MGSLSEGEALWEQAFRGDLGCPATRRRKLFFRYRNVLLVLPPQLHRTLRILTSTLTRPPTYTISHHNHPSNTRVETSSGPKATRDSRVLSRGYCQNARTPTRQYPRANNQQNLSHEMNAVSHPAIHFLILHYLTPPASP